MKTLLFFILVYLVIGNCFAGEVTSWQCEMNSFSVTGSAFDEFRFVAYPVNTSSGAANYEFIEIENGKIYDVNCDGMRPAIYSIQKDHYDPSEIRGLIDQRLGPVTPYIKEVTNLLKENYYELIPEIKCFPSEECSPGGGKQFSYTVAIVNGKPEVVESKINAPKKGSPEQGIKQEEILNKPESKTRR